MLDACVASVRAGGLADHIIVVDNGANVAVDDGVELVRPIATGASARVPTPASGEPQRLGQQPWRCSTTTSRSLPGGWRLS